MTTGQYIAYCIVILVVYYAFAKFMDNSSKARITRVKNCQNQRIIRLEHELEYHT